MLAALALATAVTAAVWAIVREVVLDKRFIGLPPVVATPSTPESGELVIQYWVEPRALRAAMAGDQAGYTPTGGRSHRASGLLEQRLTPEGVELLRSEIVATGLFGHDSLLLAASPHSVIQVRIGDRLVRVRTSSFLSGC